MPKIDLSSISKKNNPVIQSDFLKKQPKKITNKNIEVIKPIIKQNNIPGTTNL
jgi:hypothetical protein